MNHTFGNRAPGLAAVGLGVLALVIGAALSGCETPRDPRKPLSPDEGDRLLRDIREDRGRMQNLSPAEREYLMRTLKR